MPCNCFRIFSFCYMRILRMHSKVITQMLSYTCRSLQLEIPTSWEATRALVIFNNVSFSLISLSRIFVAVVEERLSRRRCYVTAAGNYQLLRMPRDYTSVSRYFVDAVISDTSRTSSSSSSSSSETTIRITGANSSRKTRNDGCDPTRAACCLRLS